MELLSSRAKRALDRMTELASGNRHLVFEALALHENKKIPDVIDYMGSE